MGDIVAIAPNETQTTGKPSEPFPVVWMALGDIKTAEPFSSLFPIDPHLVESIAKDILAGRYDKERLITYWKEKDCIVDGHTRFKALLKAVELGSKVKAIPVYMADFTNEREALDYMFRHQTKRRVLSEVQILLIAELIDVGYKRGRPSSNGTGHTAKEMAEILGIDPRTMKRVRRIIKCDKQSIIEAVKSGQIRINQADGVIADLRSGKLSPDKVEERIAELGQSNKRNKPQTVEDDKNQGNGVLEKSKTGWAHWAWSPIIRIKEGEYRLSQDLISGLSSIGEPQGTGADRNILVCPTLDLMERDHIEHEGVARIKTVLAAISAAPQGWNFIVFTKNPTPLTHLDGTSCWPRNNFWIGAHVRNREELELARQCFVGMDAGTVKFYCYEPKGENLTFYDYGVVNWLIIRGKQDLKWLRKTLGCAWYSECPVFVESEETALCREYPDPTNKDFQELQKRELEKRRSGD